MPRMTASKSLELENFWRAHLDGWRRSDLNQREYCELHGLPLKRFGNWRATLRHEEPAGAGKLLYRRGGGLKHMSKHMPKEHPSAPSSHISSARSGGSGRRRNFSEADKRRIVEETVRRSRAWPGGMASVCGYCSPGASIHDNAPYTLPKKGYMIYQRSHGNSFSFPTFHGANHVPFFDDPRASRERTRSRGAPCSD